VSERECITHHHACDCRERKFAELEAKLAIAVEALEVIGDEENSNRDEYYIAHKALAKIRKPEGGSGE